MTTSGNLPAITPSSRSFTDGFYYIAQRQVRLGGTVRVVYGQLLQETSFQLQFQNIDDAIAAEFLEAYDAAMGGLYPVTVPPELLAGTSPQFQALIANTPGQWFITNPVQVESVIPGVSTVSVDLVRDLNSDLATRIRPSNDNFDLFGQSPSLAFRAARVIGAVRPNEYLAFDSYKNSYFESGFTVNEYEPFDSYLGTYIESGFVVNEYDASDSYQGFEVLENVVSTPTP